MAITFGNVPRPEIEQRILSNAEAVEGRGWDNLGQRQPKFIALHRMVGSLWGTDIWFRRPDVASLTDFGLGIAAVDGSANAGRIMQWNDYKGTRSGWASGPVNGAYGDGLAFVNKYGINAVNRDGISIETSGTDEPLDTKAWSALVHLCAYLADEMKVPYTSLPLNPHTGIAVLIWHQEFTLGTGKKCPFSWLMANTPRLYTEMAAFMKKYQEGTATAPAPAPTAPAPATTRTFTTRFELLLRTSPGFYNYAEQKPNVVRTLPTGTKGTIISGPKEADGVDWYDISIPGIGTGWVQNEVLNTLEIKTA